MIAAGARLGSYEVVALIGAGRLEVKRRWLRPPVYTCPTPDK